MPFEHIALYNLLKEVVESTVRVGHYQGLLVWAVMVQIGYDLYRHVCLDSLVVSFQKFDGS